MYILSVDTTAKTAAVCVAADDPVLGLVPVAELTLNSTVTHSETLLPMIDQALSLSHIALSDISAMAITAGPGSFTGVRIGVSAIKGLAFSLNDKIPCIPLSTLECLARNIENYGENAILCPLMDARREQFYNALFTVRKGKAKRLCDDRVITAQELSEELCSDYSGRKIVLCGDGAELFYSLMPQYLGEKGLKITLSHPKDLYQRAFSVALCAFEKLNSADFDALDFCGEKLSPLYLRLSQAERERNEKLNQGSN